MPFTRFLYRNLQGYRFLIITAVILTFAEVGTDIFSAFPLKFIIDKQNQTDPIGGLLLHSFLPFFTEAFGEGSAIIALAVTMIVVLGLLNALLSFIQLYLASRIAKNFTTKLSKQVFNHLQRLSIQWHGTREQGDLVQRITGNMADLEKFVADGMVDTVAGSLTIVGVLVVMLITNAPFTLISLVIVPILGVVVLAYTRNIRAATKKEKKAEGQVSSVSTEAMGKIMEIKAFTLESFMFHIFTQNADKRLKAGRRAGNLQAQFAPLVDIILVTGTALIIGIGAASAAKLITHLGPFALQTVTLGTLTVFLAYLAKLYQPIRDLSKLTTLSTSASAAAERIQEVLDQKIEALEIPPHYTGPYRLRGSINYEDVLFAYNYPGQMILRGVTLKIPSGQKVALVGLSGSGKTTLTNLLPRFYEPLPGWGSVKIDNIDVTHLPLAVIRQNVSVVLQDSILFDGTIRENIKIGRPNATDAEMFKAAEQACIHDVIINRLGGYDAPVINQGKNLSGGQRQRIAIARAILRDSPIIIMDEPTASLDVEAEAEVMRALDGLAEGRTVLMITHRLSTVGKVDQIIVLKDGRIAEQGSYKQLKQRDGVFASLLKAQSAFDIDDEASRSFILTASERPDPQLSEAEILVEVDGKIVGKRQLNKVVLTIGRMAQNDIQIPFDTPAAQHVSRLHAKLLWKNQTWVIEDADSKYGLYYNGVRVNERQLVNQDRIYVAPTVALIYLQKGQRPTPPKPPVSPAPVPLPAPLVPPPVKPTRQRAQVFIELDGHVADKHTLNKDLITIGRKMEQSTNDIQISSPYITRESHAQIQWENGVWIIKPANGKNGLRYNGQSVPQHIFAHGDRVYLAPNVALLFQTS